MKLGILGLGLCLFTSPVFAGELITVSGQSSYLQVFRPQLHNLTSVRIAEAISFKQAAERIGAVCFGEILQDYNIVDEKVSYDNRGGTETVTTTITLNCENPLPSLDL